MGNSGISSKETFRHSDNRSHVHAAKYIFRFGGVFALYHLEAQFLLAQEGCFALKRC